ncbi:MAG: DoxX family membrane protein [Halorientalis sp.]
MKSRAVVPALAVVSSVVFAAGTARGHVDYVTDTTGGDVGALVRAVVTSPVSVALLAGGAVAVLLTATAYLRFAGRVPDVEVARRTLRSYQPYLPWMLRLSIGLPLVGAGFAGYLFSPAVPTAARLPQLLLGFLFLFGLATRLAAVAGLLLYLGSLALHFPALLLASEYVAGFLGILLVGPGQPSADMLLERLVVTDGTLASRFRDVPTAGDLLAGAGLTRRLAPIPVRLFLGCNFAYLGVTQKWLQPAAGYAVVAQYDLTALVPVSPELWVFGAGLVEVVVGVLFVTGTFTRGAAAVGFVLLTTTLFGLANDPVLAHVTLFGLSSVLMVTGSGAFALDTTVLPALRRRLDPTDAATSDRGTAG